MAVVVVPVGGCLPAALMLPLIGLEADQEVVTQLDKLLDEIFRAINETLSVEEGAQPKAALWGLGGIGKSQITLEHCHGARQNDVELAVFWVNAATVSRFEESYKRIAVECGLVQKDESNSGDDAA
ncbi:hypothetical protein B0H67DRAFT_558055 [Lasiosphaeris hirsuta]|uniref:NB-ARC domain-containing protein n=1 Tax=Lasiosphaeris hirsuta TaxID=260670 RepID=A0AA40DJI0_9PEZI|nr:hypothetical protein B0H67DRAFT_558055 [Lasiosphaeris hirsuta]